MGEGTTVGGELSGRESDARFTAVGQDNRAEQPGGGERLQAGQVSHDIGGGVADRDRRDVRLRGGGCCTGRGDPRHRQGVGTGDVGEGTTVGGELSGRESDARFTAVGQDNRAEQPGGGERLQAGQVSHDIGGGVADRD